ncbi:hypothetical protein H7U19_15410 [Hyunsoonleella sp. SJ7]|uniref:Uncharacterized protein n=1 Tax=Hyunsoonleella aquatilis TaxID=2762758 RepID=A0A923KN64_9FLAO|nr:DUF6090 family protein [Hyunsoonleella aquatilis]MBC3759800.1 hypothetical protein [Hyunsoonleella aquatilis]
MIKFFRKIRQKLLSENKFSKYLLYAIGEIVLVVIGILIALQINNTNERRLERFEEIKLLENLKVDFQQTIREFQGMNINRDSILFANYSLTDLKTKGDFNNERKIDTLLATTFICPTFNGKSSSLMMLFNSGKINILKNEALKTLLFSWPSEIEDMTEGEIDSKLITYNFYIPIIRQYVNISSITRTTTILPIKIRNRDSAILNDYMGLLNNREFENLLYQLELLTLDNIQETKSLIRIAESIIEIINSELEQYK